MSKPKNIEIFRDERMRKVTYAQGELFTDGIEANKPETLDDVRNKRHFNRPEWTKVEVKAKNRSERRKARIEAQKGEEPETFRKNRSNDSSREISAYLPLTRLGSERARRERIRDMVYRDARIRKEILSDPPEEMPQDLA